MLVILALKLPVLVKTTDRELLVVPTASGVLLVAVTAPDVNIGLVRLELLRAAEAVG